MKESSTVDVFTYGAVINYLFYYKHRDAVRTTKIKNFKKDKCS